MRDDIRMRLRDLQYLVEGKPSDNSEAALSLLYAMADELVRLEEGVRFANRRIDWLLARVERLEGVE